MGLIDSRNKVRALDIQRLNGLGRGGHANAQPLFVIIK